MTLFLAEEAQDHEALQKAPKTGEVGPGREFGAIWCDLCCGEMMKNDRMAVMRLDDEGNQMQMLISALKKKKKKSQAHHVRGAYGSLDLRLLDSQKLGNMEKKLCVI